MSGDDDIIARDPSRPTQWIKIEVSSIGSPRLRRKSPLDETCFSLAVDFDKNNWLEDSTFIETCRRMNLSAALERARSGRGGHVWLFFEEAVPATLARKLGSHLLTETMERRPDIGLDSYDRFFPNQDTLPHGGFGNLIALPLQKHRRGDGNSVFLDDQGVPHRDQWSFLSTVQRIERGQLEDVVREAHSGDHTPIVQLHLRYGMILFIASEVMFFVAWFWAFFDASLFPNEAAQLLTAIPQFTPAVDNEIKRFCK